MYVLFESASGYSLFDVSESEDIAKGLAEVQKDILNLDKFGKNIVLKSFLPFQNAAAALENANAVSDGTLSSTLKSFLEMNIPVSKKKSTAISLGVSDKTLATAIKQELSINCISNELVFEIIRGIRLHADKLLKQLSTGDLEKAQLGLAHSFSRSKVKYNVNRSDNMIIQAVCLSDQLDKDLNLFSMRIKEWYSWHFPELSNLVTEQILYARLAVFIGDRATLSPSSLDSLVEILGGDVGLAKKVLSASNSSMGTQISPIDLMNINHFGKKLISLIEYRKRLGLYLSDKMNIVAPNLGALIGETVGARLISHAGSLVNLAKFPASTVQILGAEKALFRALKTKGKTPKYGLIFHSSFIGRAAYKNKGRISRYLANKCSIASRIDSFSDEPSFGYGVAMRNQVEKRLEFYETGVAPPTNESVMNSIEMDSDATEKKEKRKDKKEKKEKKDKKHKKK